MQHLFVIPIKRFVFPEVSIDSDALLPSLILEPHLWDDPRILRVTSSPLDSGEVYLPADTGSAFSRVGSGSLRLSVS